MKRYLMAIIVLRTSSYINAGTAPVQGSADREAIAKIRDEWMNRSQALETFTDFTEVIGPSLTATPAYKTPPSGRGIGRRPEITALVIIGGSIATEICQRYWPKGLFAGRYDPYNIVTYAIGVGICYVFDRRLPVKTGLKSAAQ
jgi:hypothetical protein